MNLFLKFSALIYFHTQTEQDVLLSKKHVISIQIDQGLLSHTPNGDGVPPPPKKKLRANALNYSLKFRVLAPITLGPVAVTSRNFPRDVPRGRDVNVGTTFDEDPPLKFGRAKNV